MRLIPNGTQEEVTQLNLILNEICQIYSTKRHYLTH